MNNDAYLELLMGFLDGLAIGLLAPVMSIFSEESGGTPVEHVEGTACVQTHAVTPCYCSSSSSPMNTVVLLVSSPEQAAKLSCCPGTYLVACVALPWRL